MGAQKITEQLFRQIKYQLDEGETISSVARAFRLGWTTVQRIEKADDFGEYCEATRTNDGNRGNGRKASREIVNLIMAVISAIIFVTIFIILLVGGR